MRGRCYPSIILLFTAVLLFAGCAAFPRVKSYKPLPQGSQCRMTVVPFSYAGDFVRGSDIVSKTFTAALAATPGFELLPEGDLLHYYRLQNLFPLEQLNEEQMRMLAQRYDLQYVIEGDILKIEEIDAALEVKTALTMVVHLRDGRTGELLMTTYHSRTGEDYRKVLHFGHVNSLSGLSRRMSHEIIELWKENGMDQCER